MSKLTLLAPAAFVFSVTTSTVFAKTCEDLGKTECDAHAAACYFKEGRKCASRPCSEKDGKVNCENLRGCVWKKVQKKYKCTGTAAFF